MSILRIRADSMLYSHRRCFAGVVTDGRYLSDAFFHFVGRAEPSNHGRNYQTLKLILNAGCIRHPRTFTQHSGQAILRDLGKSLLTGDLIVPAMVCVADIPSHDLAIHMRKYGCFGLGLKKAHCIWFGARPVTYVPMRQDDSLGIHGRSLLRDIEATYRGFLQYLAPATATRGARTLAQVQSRDDAVAALQALLELHVLAFLKPFDSQLENDDPEHYYAEREWRCLGDLHFDRKDIAEVCVHEDYVDTLRRDFDWVERVTLVSGNAR